MGRRSSRSSGAEVSYNRSLMERHICHHQARCGSAEPCDRTDPRAHRGGRVHVRAMRMIHMSKAEAEGFYHVHRERPFFDGLTDFMSSGPCVVLCLEAPDAIRKWRDLMGATDPAKAADGHAAQGVRRVDRQQRDARLGRARDGGVRARLLLSRHGTLSACRRAGRDVDCGPPAIVVVGLIIVAIGGGDLAGCAAWDGCRVTWSWRARQASRSTSPITTSAFWREPSSC